MVSSMAPGKTAKHAASRLLYHYQWRIT